MWMIRSSGWESDIVNALTNQDSYIDERVKILKSLIDSMGCGDEVLSILTREYY